MSILDNELVKKYFGTLPGGIIRVPEVCIHGCNIICEKSAMALRILKAMEADMEMYEKAIYTHNEGKTWKEGDITGVPFKNEFHPTWLRLPDQFQAIRCRCHCKHDKCGCSITCHWKPDQAEDDCKCFDGAGKHFPGGCPKPDTVEQKIKEIFELYKEVAIPAAADGKFPMPGSVFQGLLHELVELVRKEK